MTESATYGIVEGLKHGISASHICTVCQGLAGMTGCFELEDHRLIVSSERLVESHGGPIAQCSGYKRQQLSKSDLPGDNATGVLGELQKGYKEEDSRICTLCQGLAGLDMVCLNLDGHRVTVLNGRLTDSGLPPVEQCIGRQKHMQSQAK